MFSILATLIFALLAVFWTRKTLGNLLIKLALWAMATWGCFIVLVQLGYVVKGT